MRLQLVQATGTTRQLNEIVEAFTPPMRRVCRHLADADLRAMVERMALHKLAEEQRRCTPPRRRGRGILTDRVYGPLHSC